MLSATTSRQSMLKHGSRNSPALDAIEAELACKRGVERDESRWHVKRKRTMCTLFDVGWQTRGYLCRSAGGITDGIYTQYSNMSASTARWPSGLRRSIKEDILSTQEVTCYLRAWVRIPLLSPFFFFVFLAGLLPAFFCYSF